MCVKFTNIVTRKFKISIFHILYELNQFFFKNAMTFL